MKLYNLLFSMLSITSISIASDWGSSENLTAAANDLNKNLPMMVDKITEAFVVTPRDHELEFSYRVVTLQASEIDINTNGIKSDRINYTCSTPTIRPLIDRGISIRYSYYDKNRQYIFSTLVKKSDCNP